MVSIESGMIARPLFSGSRRQRVLNRYGSFAQDPPIDLRPFKSIALRGGI
jgi:hypothetical protein